MKHDIVLFDGICNLCNATINFVIDRDPTKRIRFASLQSSIGQNLLKANNLSTTDFDSVVLIDERGHCFQKSSAALKIAKKMKGIWPLLYVFIIIPPFLRNIFYDIVAKNRYKWFGQSETCRVPTPEYQEHFLDWSEQMEQLMKQA
jgi:predicted DCC family thiol-disulfide oxidoreductase YuxK